MLAALTFLLWVAGIGLAAAIALPLLAIAVGIVIGFIRGCRR